MQSSHTTAEALTALLGSEISDADEETFFLYAEQQQQSTTVQPQPSSSSGELGAAAAEAPLALGLVDGRAECVNVEVAGRSVEVRQAPGVLASGREGGTTGAALWQVTPQFANWLSSPTNPLLNLLLPSPPASPTPTSTSTSSSPSSTLSGAILELGCGISPLNALALRHRVATYILSDQIYVQKLVLRNLASATDDENTTITHSSEAKTRSSARRRRRHGQGAKSTRPIRPSVGNVYFRPLDWETDAITPALSAPQESFHLVLASDCVYNEALVPSFVQTCLDACRLRQRQPQPQPQANHHEAETKKKGDNKMGNDNGDGRSRPCACIIAQQLRSDAVLSAWLDAFLAAFRVWRVPGGMLPEGMRAGAGFVVHVGVLRDERWSVQCQVVEHCRNTEWLERNQGR